MVKSCDDCVLRVSREEMIQRGEDPGADVCGLGRGPISLPFPVHPSSAARKKASNCEDFSADPLARIKVSRPLNLAKVFEGLPDGTLPIPMKPDENCVSCLMCEFFVAPHDADKAGHWPVGICAAKGKLVQATTYLATARDCKFRSFGRLRPGILENLTLIDEYSSWTLNVDDEESEVLMSIKVDDARVVTSEESEQGIESWLKVLNPSNDEQFVHLPRFSEDAFPVNDRAAIPRTGDDEYPEGYLDHQGLVYKIAVLWMQLNETPSLVGQAGVGKTEAFRHLAWLMQMPFYRISITGSTEVEDLAGKMHYEPSRGTYFEYGRLPSAWMKAGVICLDEPNVGPPDVWQFIRPLTDNSKQLVLDMNAGERVSRHPYAFLGMAMNPAWDVKNAGTATLADADGSRLMHIYAELPDVATERVIISRRVALDGWKLTKDQLDMVMAIAKDLRGLCENDTLPITWGIRPQIKVARALRWFTPQQAYRLAAADYLEPEQQNLILDIVKAHQPSTTKPKSEGAPRIRTREERIIGPRPGAK